MSNFNANGPGRSNHTIVNRITTNWSLDGNRKSDTSRYWETKKLVAVSMAGKQLQTEEIKTKLNKKRA